MNRLILVDPVVKFFFGLLFGVAVVLLDFAGDLVEFALGYFPIVIGELAPYFFRLALELLPFSFYLVFVHHPRPFLNGGGKRKPVWPRLKPS